MKATDAIIEQIDNLFSDTSIGKSETLYELETILDDLDFKISALKEDIKRDNL